jgi:hypothetical protein
LPPVPPAIERAVLGDQGCTERANRSGIAFQEDSMQYTRLYADAEGDSHFEDVSVPVTPVTYAPPAPPVHLSAFVDAARVGFVQEATGWLGGWHPSPRRQFVIVLGETFRVEVSDGEVRDFRPGAVILLEDTTGNGHHSQFIGAGDSMLALVHLADERRAGVPAGHHRHLPRAIGHGMARGAGDMKPGQATRQPHTYDGSIPRRQRRGRDVEDWS